MSPEVNLGNFKPDNKRRKLFIYTVTPIDPEAIGVFCFITLMEQLIKVTEKDGKHVVSARELHEFLESKQDFTTWIKGKIEKYGFVENEDFTLHKFMEGKSWRHEYIVLVEVAKELAMVEGNEKGRDARRYFIECEKKLVGLAKRLSPLEILLQSAQALVDHEKRLDGLDNKVLQLEARQKNTPSDYFTIIGYSVLKHTSLDLEQAKMLGKKAAKICIERELHTGTIPDPRFGKIKIYPKEVLEEVFNEFLGIADNY